jgi:hypothetical protein
MTTTRARIPTHLRKTAKQIESLEPSLTGALNGANAGIIPSLYNWLIQTNSSDNQTFMSATIELFYIAASKNCLVPLLLMKKIQSQFIYDRSLSSAFIIDLTLRNVFLLEDENKTASFFRQLIQFRLLDAIYPHIDFSPSGDPEDESKSYIKSEIIGISIMAARNINRGDLTLAQAMKSWYASLLIVTDDSHVDHDNIICANPLIDIYYGRVDQKLLAKKIASQEKIRLHYTRRCQNNLSISYWLRDDVFGFGNAHSNFELLLATDLIKKLFPALSRSIYAEKEYLKTIMEMVDSRKWKEWYGSKAFNAGYLGVIYAHFITVALFQCNSRDKNIISKMIEENRYIRMYFNEIKIVSIHHRDTLFKAAIDHYTAYKGPEQKILSPRSQLTKSQSTFFANRSPEPQVSPTPVKNRYGLLGEFEFDGKSDFDIEAEEFISIRPSV